MRLLPIEKKIDHLAHLTVIDLTMKVFIYHLGPLFSGNVGENIGRQISGDVNISRGKGDSGSMTKLRRQAGQHRHFHIPGRRHARGVNVMSV